MASKLAAAPLVSSLLLTGCGGRTADASDTAHAHAVDDAGSDSVAETTDGPLPARAASCASPRPGADDACGSIGSEDCCGFARVEGGTFHRFYDVNNTATMAYPATVSTFYLDKFEVTVGRFRAFVEAYDLPKHGVGASSHVTGSGWQSSWPIAADAASLKKDLASECTEGTLRTWTDEPGPNERLPINCITWYELFAFCAWDGGRLPSLTEHHYAASGGAEQRVYPWSAPPESEALDLSYAQYALDILATPPLESVGARPKGRGRWGQYDLSGSISEFSFDTGNPPLICVDCIQLVDLAGEPPTARAVLGGNFAEGKEWLPARQLDYRAVGVRDRIIGGRCARE